MAYTAQIQASKLEKADLVKQLLAAEAQVSLTVWHQRQCLPLMMEGTTCVISLVVILCDSH